MMTFTSPPDLDVIGALVRHPLRPDLGVGRVTAVFAGKPSVCRVEWPETVAGVTRWGYYQSTSLVREETSG